MASKLTQLRCNLQEVYSAVHRNSGTLLVANIQGTRIYDAACGWGRVWRWFYGIIGCFTREFYQTEKLLQAIQTTHRIFHNELHHIKKHIENYHTYLKQVCSASPVHESDFHAARKAITIWNDATLPFVQLLRSGRNNHLNRIFENRFDLDEETLKFCLQYQNIIDLEGILHQPLPIEILAKMATGTAISETNRALFQKWITKINEQARIIGIQRFHRALRGIIEHLMDINANPIDTSFHLAKLELHLIDAKCQAIFMEKDPKHIAWRRTLKSGDSLTSSGTTFVLGEQIGHKADGIDRTLVFNIATDPKSVMIIGISRAILGIKQIMRNEYHGELELVAFKHVDPRGRFAIVEKLPRSLDGFQWTSTAQKVSRADEQRCKPIVRMLNQLLQNEKTPAFFSPKYLGIDAKGILKCMKVTHDTIFDFNALEQFVYSVANRNLTIFRHLMSASGLSSHLFARYYQQMVEHAIKDKANAKERDAGRVADTKGSGVDDPRVVDRAQALYREVRQMKKRCFDLLSELHSNALHPALLETRISKYLLEYYLNSKAGNILWPTLEQDVVNTIIQSQKR